MGSGGKAPCIFSFTLDGGKLPVYPPERAPGTHLIGGWVWPRASLDAVTKRKTLSLSGFESRSSKTSLITLLVEKLGLGNEYS